MHGSTNEGCKRVSLDFVSSMCHIVNNAQPAQPNICKVASDNLNDRVQKLVKLCRPAGLILSLYSSALYFKSNITFNQTVHMAAPYATILGSQKLEHLIATIEVLSGYFSEKGEDGNASGLFLAYMDVLEFWCQVLLPCVEAGWRNYYSKGKDFLNSPNWSNVFEVLQTFCCFGINAFKAKIVSGKVDKERTDETHQMLLKSLLSGLRICFFAATPYESCRFKGSSLQVMGPVVDNGELAIVDGTGEFPLANGVIYKKLHEQKPGNNIVELQILAFYCPLCTGESCWTLGI